MGQAICIRKDEKPLGYDWECGHEELYVRVNMYYNGSLYVGLWQKQEECEEKLELFGDLTIGVMGFLRPGQAIISDCGAKAKVAFIEKYKLGKVIGKRKINYGSYYVVEFNLARLAQLDPEGTERYAIKRKGRKPTEFLSVDKKEFRRLRDMNGGVKELKWLQLEKSTGKTIGDEEICWMVKEGFEPNDLKFVLDQMSICQIRHYLVKQSEKSGDDISHVLQVWNDYLSMAKRLGMDIHDSIIYRTRDLQLRHKEAVLKIEEMKRGIRRRELEEKYVGFQKHLIDLKEKYEFSDGEYQVIAPKSIDDILYEGDTLHHCVNKTDTYFDRIVSKESYILFLREKENPKVPFYTLEVEPDGTIRQKRAEFNRQNKDIDKVTSFLTLWQKEIQKRLTKKDRKSTEESRKLRQQNYQEIRDKHVVVHGGAFAGELLADLLEKDLMDLPVESAENGESPTEIAA